MLFAFLDSWLLPIIKVYIIEFNPKNNLFHDTFFIVPTAKFYFFFTSFFTSFYFFLFIN